MGNDLARETSAELTEGSAERLAPTRLSSLDFLTGSRGRLAVRCKHGETRSSYLKLLMISSIFLSRSRLQLAPQRPRTKSQTRARSRKYCSLPRSLCSLRHTSHARRASGSALSYSFHHLTASVRDPLVGACWLTSVRYWHSSGSCRVVYTAWRTR